MGKWRVKTIQLGTISADKSGITHYRGLGTKLELPVWCVAVTDGKTRILVDTGMDDIDWVIGGPEPFAHQKESERMRPALKAAMGWDPGDVDAVVNTHLHFDHCCCNHMFKNADIYVQRRELETAYAPPPGVRHLYAARCFDKKAIPYFQWKLLDGEAEIFPGVIAFPTPGHTFGHQSVLVDMEEGSLCVAGDVVGLVENINDNVEGGTIMEVEAYYRSFVSIRRKADFIVPGHEPGIANHMEKGFPAIA
jgi:glyoxylase-like metal-dependent hydrolase (beta-lactamase superfamily II)